MYPATIVGIPPMEDFYIIGASVKLFLPIFKMNFPELVDIALPAEGVFHNLVFVSIRKTYPMRRGSIRRFPVAPERNAHHNREPKAEPFCANALRVKPKNSATKVACEPAHSRPERHPNTPRHRQHHASCNDGRHCAHCM